MVSTLNRGPVLVVEDEPLILMFTSAALMDAGFATLEAANAEEAIRYLDYGARISALVTDIDLPGAGERFRARMARTRSQSRNHRGVGANDTVK